MTIEVIVNESKLSLDDEELIKKILLVANIKRYNLTNIRYYNFPDTYRENIFIAFGAAAAFQAKKIDSYATENIIIFPAIGLLYDKKVNENHREKAFELINIIKNKLIIKEISIHDMDINYTVEQLLEIPKMFSEQNGITIINSTGKKIRISFKNNDPESADIKVKYEELVAIKLATEILKNNIKEK